MLKSLSLHSADLVRAAAAIVIAISLFLAGAHSGEEIGDEVHSSSACLACLVAAPVDRAGAPPSLIARSAPLRAQFVALTAQPVLAIREAASQPRAPPFS